nr:hypothetical protein [Lachnospiraceae bacterium]
MDRNDYKNLISEAKALMKSGGEADALDLLDGVNWRKIHNVNALIEISNLYEQLGHIEDSRMLLTFAHERSPIGRMILYHLTLVCVKMDDIDEAEKYLDEFVQIAPHDSKKYILRYNIAKAKGADIKEQITILEEMKNSDFIEEWAFELAYLYYKAGEADKCIALCDEIVIWFGDGPYVTKALELKMLYSPLDDEQAEKYQDLTRKKKGVTHFKRNEMLESGEVIHHDIDIATVEETPGHLNTVNLQAEIKRNIEEIMEATKEGEVSDNLENIKELIEEIPYLQEKETLDDVANKQKKDNKELGTSIKNQFKELLEEDNDGQMSLFVPEEDEVEEQVEGQITIQDVMDNWAKTQRAAEEVLENAEDMKLKKAKQNAIEEASHIMNKLEGVMPRLEAGVTPSELMKEEVMTQADEARAAEEEAIETEAASEAKELEAPRADSKDAEEAEIAARIKEFTDKKANADAEKVNAAKAEINKEPKKQETNKVPDQQEANKEPAEKESHTYTVPKFAADGTRIDDGLKIPVIEPVGKNVFGKENANEEGPALIKDNMPNWHPPVLSEEEIKNSNILRNKENEVQLEEASKVVAELNESLQKRIDETVKSQAEEQPIEEEIATEEEVVEEEVPATVEEVVEEEVPATVEEEVEEEELEIDPLEMEEEPLEE